jgi:hypothetical protein
MSALASKKSSPRNNCSDLQTIANRVGKEEGYTFQGFENLTVRTDVYEHNRGNDRLCQLGYFTHVSPMGKKICKGHIYTNVKSPNIRWAVGPFRSTFYDPVNLDSEYCRYIS